MPALQKYSDIANEVDALSKAVVDCVFQVHKNLGPGFPEKIYEVALGHELRSRNINFEMQKPIKVIYPPDIVLEPEYKLDMVIDNKILLELKCVQTLLPVHDAQIYAYLKMSGLPLGLLINFYTPLIKNGIKRFVLKSSS